MAPCCWREPLTSHRSPKADQAREELLALVRAGRGDGEIREAFIGRYGEAILLVPEGERARWLFATPLVVTLAAMGLGGWFLASARQRQQRPGTNGGLPPDELDEAELDEAELEW